MRPNLAGILLVLGSLSAAGCGQVQVKPSAESMHAAEPARRAVERPARWPSLTRVEFNRLAVQLDVPLFWLRDDADPGVLDPDELTLLGVGLDRSRFVTEGGFTAAFRRIEAAMIERRRQEALVAELDQGRATLVYTDLAGANRQDQALVRQVTAAARTIEEIYALQRGSFDLRACLSGADSVGQAVFRRNQGPWCQAPATEGDPFCNACPDFPPELSGLYPRALQRRPDFCKLLGDQPNAAALLDPFTVVREAELGEGFVAVPYSTFYADRMRRVATQLRTAADTTPKGEQALKRYLLAAARAFETNQWQPADEAWAAMNATNSRWYLRIGPDEVYFEPCNRKAGFHVSFARIDPDSIYWQDKLTPLRQQMETALAEVIGAPYKARQVSVHMPDFIEIILNAGDSRAATGATIGQSLPNWGEVAEQGRGRTVVMSNLYTDPDSKAITRTKAEALLSAEAMRHYTDDKRLGLLDIVLHEASHNFGPHSDTKIDGKRPGDIFGGSLASVLEELKAQTGALYFVGWLMSKGVIDADQAHEVWLHAIIWCFGHISQGLIDSKGRPKPYSQVAAVQVGFLSREGALSWQAEQPAANGRDQGRFQIDFGKFGPAVEKLMQQVGRIKTTGDVAGAKALIQPFISGQQHGLLHQPEIAARVRRQPKASFVYGVSF